VNEILSQVMASLYRRPVCKAFRIDNLHKLIEVIVVIIFQGRIHPHPIGWHDGTDGSRLDVIDSDASTRPGALAQLLHGMNHPWRWIPSVR
jgi:hypothetical protein